MTQKKHEDQAGLRLPKEPFLGSSLLETWSLSPQRSPYKTRQPSPRFQPARRPKPRLAPLQSQAAPDAGAIGAPRGAHLTERKERRHGAVLFARMERRPTPALVWRFFFCADGA